MAASFNPGLLQQAASTIADEAEGLGYSHVFAPVLDLSRELRWGRVEENFGEDPFLCVFYVSDRRVLYIYVPLNFSGLARWDMPMLPGYNLDVVGIRVLPL